MNTNHDTQPATATRWHDEESFGRIVMAGRDAAALLQRLTTNDVVALQHMQGLQTVLTTPIGRIIDVLHVLRVDDVLWILTSLAQGPGIYSHLKKNIFFNDHVTLTPAARSHQQFAVYGPDATALVAQHFAVPPTLARWHGAAHRNGIAHGWCSPIAPLNGGGWRIVVPQGSADPIVASLESLPSDELNCWQIEAGVPAFGHELSTEFIPLEAGLEEAISFNKGCYVGQEIIARMESRGRRAKQLQRIRLTTLVSAPAPLTTADGRDAGVVTRVVDSPRYGVIGMAYIKTAMTADVPLYCGTTPVTRIVETRQEVASE